MVHPRLDLWTTRADQDPVSAAPFSRDSSSTLESKIQGNRSGPGRLAGASAVDAMFTEINTASHTAWKFGLAFPSCTLY